VFSECRSRIDGRVHRWRQLAHDRGINPVPTGSAGQMQDASEILALYQPRQTTRRFHLHDQPGPSPHIGDLLREFDRDPMAVFWDSPSWLGH
jgi:hypothetical protein